MEQCLVPAREARHEIKVSNSRFIATAGPVLSVEEAKALAARIRREYPDATHHVLAYVIGHGNSVTMHCNDDGEPSGTAGRPILGQIQSKDLTNLLVVVVRYYGGTKLGVSGLINAYKTAAKEALEANTVIEKTVQDVYEVFFNYDQMNDVMRILKDEQVTQLSHQFDTDCIIKFSVRQQHAGHIVDLLNKLKDIKVNFVATV